MEWVWWLVAIAIACFFLIVICVLLLTVVDPQPFWGCGCKTCERLRKERELRGLK